MDYSVIIPTQNRPELVCRALRSVYAQTCGPSHVIIIDDASQPPLSLPSELRDSRTRIIRHERATGAAVARNSGLLEAPTKIVAFLDDDDEWLPAKMEVQLAWLRNHPDATLVTCGHFRCEGGHEYREVFTQSFCERYRHHHNFFGSFSYLVIRRWPFEILLDPALPALQDWDFALRVTRGASFGVIEEPLVKYHAHDLPRITNRAGNHLRGLRRCYLKHRLCLSPDARRWLLGRVIFERSRCIFPTRKRLPQVAFSIALSLPCRVPWMMKLRVVGRRVASLGISPAAVAAIRCTMIATVQNIRTRFSPGKPASAASVRAA